MNSATEMMQNSFILHGFHALSVDHRLADLLLYVSCLSRPAYCTPRVLEKAGLKLSDISVFEYHEAFAVRTVLLTFAVYHYALAPPTACRENLVYMCFAFLLA